jgi:hypothetical protein
MKVLAKIATRADDGGTMHRWYRVTRLGEAEIEAVRPSEPGSPPATFAVSEMSGWMLVAPGGPFSPHSLDGLRALRERPSASAD